MKVIAQLRDGYVPLEGEDRTPQKRVVISRRPTGKDLCLISADASSELTTNFNLMHAAACITQWGNLSMPVPLGVLLKLKRYDRDDLLKGRDEFLTQTLGECTAKVLPDGKAQLAFGLRVGEQIFDIATFGNSLTGFQEVEIEAKTESGWRRLLSLMSLELTGLSQSEGAAVHSEPLDVATFEAADWFDLIVLQDARQRWLDSFRREDAITIED